MIRSVTVQPVAGSNSTLSIIRSSPRSATNVAGRPGGKAACSRITRSRLIVSSRNRPPGFSARRNPASTARFVSSSKYPNDVNQLTTASNRPSHGMARRSPST